MRSLLFLGKGGVGKTTCALGTALSLARAGRRTLVASLDPAHSLGDLAGVELGDAPVELAPRLAAVEVDLEGRRRRTVRQVTDVTRRSFAHLAALGLESMTGLLAHAPGMEEQAALEALAELIELPDIEVLVVDAPATALATRMLALPALSSAWLERLTRLRRTILERRQSIEHIQKTGEPAPGEGDDPVMRQLGREGGRMAVLAEWTASPETDFALVVNPDLLSVREARRHLSLLSTLGRAPSLWILNRDRGEALPSSLVELTQGAEPVRRPLLDRPLSGRQELADHGEAIRLAFGL